MPFLGPAIALWVTLSVGVMVCYFLFIAPRAQRGSSWYDPSVTVVPAVSDSLPRWGRTESTEPAPATVPAYEMEQYPTDKWGPSAA